MASKKIAVIGAGLGGLSATIRLATNGYKVEVFEKNNFPGGKAGEVIKDGFRFDTGPSLLTMPFVIEDLFKSAGENLNDYFQLKPLSIACKYFYPDGTIINAHSDLNEFAKEIESKTADKSFHLFKYLDYCKIIYDLTAELFLFNGFSSLKNLMNRKALNTLTNIMKIDPFRTMHKANSEFFHDKRVIQLFDRYATYNGSNPYLTPATLNIIPHVEYNLGSYIINTGVSSLPVSLEIIAIKKGVIFHYNRFVNRINRSGNKVTGIKVDSIDHKFDAVISNSDVHFTYNKLLSDQHSRQAKRYSNIEPSSSAIVFYWGVKNNSDNLEIHNILFSEDYKKEFDYLFERKICPDDPTVYIYISSKFNESDAPNGFENWFVMINAPYNTGQDWTTVLKNIRKIVLDKIEKFLKIELKDRIVFEEVMMPKDIEQNTLSSFGSIYGISSNNRMAAFLRQQNRSTKYNGLYFAGGSAHPGGGIPLAILSGKIASELIIRDDNK